MPLHAQIETGSISDRERFDETVRCAGLNAQAGGQAVQSLAVDRIDAQAQHAHGCIKCASWFDKYNVGQAVLNLSGHVGRAAVIV